MIIYEVNLEVQKDIIEPFLNWLYQHIQTIVNFDGFTGAELCQETCNTDDLKYCVRYSLTSIQALDHYLKDKAPAMRQDGLNQFGNKFIATRKILYVDKVFTPEQPCM